MVQPTDSLLRKNPTQSYGTNPTVRRLFLKSEMRTVLMIVPTEYSVQPMGDAILVWSKNSNELK